MCSIITVLVVKTMQIGGNSGSLNSQKKIMKIFRLLKSRAFFVGLLLLIQFVIIALAIVFFSGVVRIYYTIFRVLGIIVVCRIINKKENPGYKIAWSLFILVIPPFGVIVYYIFRGNHISGAIKKACAQMYGIMSVNDKEFRADKSILKSDIDPIAERQINYIYKTANCPAYTNTQCQYFSIGEDFFESLLCELDKAEKYIFLEYFIIDKGIMWDKIHQILKRKVADGVDVRIIYDDMGCISNLSSRYYKTLRREGIKCQVFNRFIPVMSAFLNNRNHRKICVIDGIVGYTGGVNLADEYINEIHPIGHWKDNAVLLRGNAVWSLTIMFLSMWESLENPRLGEAKDFSSFLPESFGDFPYDGSVVQPYTDSPLDNNPVGENVYLNMIYTATEYIWITTPYLIIDYNMEQALINAKKSGIDVRIVVPGIPDKFFVNEATKSNYKVLLDAGIKLYEYTPGFIHAKTFVVDGKYATVGTVNLDYRSLFLHFECGVWLYRSPAIADIVKDLEDTFKLCHSVTEADCKVNVFRRVLRAIIGLAAPLI